MGGPSEQPPRLHLSPRRDSRERRVRVQGAGLGAVGGWAVGAERGRRASLSPALAPLSSPPSWGPSPCTLPLRSPNLSIISIYYTPPNFPCHQPSSPPRCPPVSRFSPAQEVSTMMPVP